jgi:hypothetical protein
MAFPPKIENSELVPNSFHRTVAQSKAIEAPHDAKYLIFHEILILLTRVSPLENNT